MNGGGGGADDGKPFVHYLMSAEEWRSPDRCPTRPLVLACVAVAAAALLAFAGVAAAVNPRGEFPWQVIPPVSSEDPAYKRWLLEQRPASPQVLILGSSRSQKVAPVDVEEVSGLSAFNFALADAYPGDALVVYDAVGDDVRPREIIVGLDLNRLEPRGEPSLRTRYAFGPLQHAGATPLDWTAALYATWTPLYARQTAVALLETTGVVGAGLVGFDADGLAHYVPWETAVAHGTFDQDATITAFIVGREGYPPYVGLDPRHVADIRELVDHARADNVTVRVWLTPVHPRVEASYGNTSYPIYRAEARQLLASLCAPGVHAHDFSDLASFGGTPAGFYDGSHMNGDNTRQVVTALYEGRDDLCAAADQEATPRPVFIAPLR